MIRELEHMVRLLSDQLEFMILSPAKHCSGTPSPASQSQSTPNLASHSVRGPKLCAPLPAGPHSGQPRAFCMPAIFPTAVAPRHAWYLVLICQDCCTTSFAPHCSTTAATTSTQLAHGSHDEGRLGGLTRHTWLRWARRMRGSTVACSLAQTPILSCL